MLQVSEMSVFTTEELKRFYRPVISADGVLFEIIAPGCPTLHEDNEGDTPFSALAEFLTYGRTRALRHPGFNISETRGGKYQLFITYMEYEVSLEFYKDRRFLMLYYPMKFSTRVHSVGKSSLNLVTVMRNAVTGSPVAYSYGTLVRVNLETRRSDPIPEHIRKRFENITEKFKTQRDEFSSLAPPADAIVLSVRTRSSDSDVNGHVNYSYYYNYCIDATRNAASEGKLLHFLPSIDLLLVKKLKSSYVQECRSGEILNVTLWPDEELSEKIHYRINKENGQVACICSIEFYERDDYSRLGLGIADENASILNPVLTNPSFTLSEYDWMRWRRIALSHEGTRAETIQPAPLVFNVNQKRQLANEAPMQYITSTNRTVMVDPGYCTRELIPEGCATFLVQLHCEYERNLYTTFRRNHLSIPLRCIIETDSLGKTSAYFSVKLLETEHETCLVTMRTKQVFVDLVSRKSMPIEEKVRQRYGKYCANSKGFRDVRDSDLQPPDKCFTHSDVVRHSDIDANHHMNQIIYIRLCLDATQAASENNGLGQFVGDGYSRELKNLRSSYAREFNAGEVVHVKVWQDSDSADAINFRVLKNDGSLSMLCSMEFFPLRAEAKL